MRRLSILALALLLVSALSGCKGEYSTEAASPEEVEEVTRFVRSYLKGIDELPAAEKAKVRPALRNVRLVRLSVSRMGAKYKVLAELRDQEGKRRKCFLIVVRDRGQYRLEGLL